MHVNINIYPVYLSTVILLYSGTNYLLCAWDIFTKKKRKLVLLTFMINKYEIAHSQNILEENLSQFSLVSKFIQQIFTIFNCIDSTMLDALEEENTYVREPILKGEREENP